MLSTFFNPLLVLLSFSTITGLVLHDTRLDKATSIAMSPFSVGAYEAVKAMQNTDWHTHVERSGMTHTMNILHSSVPGLQPRLHEDRKHLLQRHMPKGHHPFDNYNLPVLG